MVDLLNIFDKVHFDESVVKYEFHTYLPYLSSSFNYNDEIRIPIQTQDIYTAPCDSYIYIEGSYDGDAATKIISNAWTFLFSEIRYELGGVEIDRVRDVGITSTIKGYCSLNKAEEASMAMSGWLSKRNNPNPTMHTNNVSVCIPLKFLLGFAEDYRKCIVHTKQELVLFRSSNDKDLFLGAKAADKFTINKIQWHVPHIVVNDELKLKILKYIDRPIAVPFRQWEFHQLPQIKQTGIDKWAVRTSSQLEKPRFILLAFQTSKRNELDQDAGVFTTANVRDIKLFLNSESFPYDKFNLDFSKGRYSQAFKSYCEFQRSYYGRDCDPAISYVNFKDYPIFVIDCSKQNEAIKSSAVDIQLEFEANGNFPANTTVYCLILHDTIIEYNPTNGTVYRNV